MWTDVVQATVMLGSTALTVYYGVRDVGGISKVFEVADLGHRMEFFE